MYSSGDGVISSNLQIIYLRKHLARLTWIISVISAMACCLERSSVVKVPPNLLGAVGLGIFTFNAVDINSKTCMTIHLLIKHILYMKGLHKQNHEYMSVSSHQLLILLPFYRLNK